MRSALRIADRAAQIARVAYLNQRQARVLLVIGAQAAVERAAVPNRRVELQRHLPGLERGCNIKRDTNFFLNGMPLHFIIGFLARCVIYLFFI